MALSDGISSMKYRLAVFSLLLAPALLANGSAIASDSEDIVQILQVERDVCAAYEREDAQWLSKHLDPRFTLTGSNGQVTTREQEVADLENGTHY
ncbi:MAG: DUF4440 domain-containing protein, partial [Luteimonas sp.]